LTVSEPEARPLCTGTAWLVPTSPVEVDLLPAAGFLPPLLMHWYTAVFVPPQVPVVEDTLPSPDTSYEQTSWPALLTLNDELLKFAAAVAVATPKTKTPSRTSAKIKERCCRMIFLLGMLVHPWCAHPKGLVPRMGELRQ
jgi:hypothetical protein